MSLNAWAAAELQHQLWPRGGLLHQFCVRYSAEDASREDFRVIVVEGACRSPDVDGAVVATRESLNKLGIVCTTIKLLDYVRV